MDTTVIVPAAIDERLTYSNVLAITEEQTNLFLKSYNSTFMIKLSATLFDCFVGHTLDFDIKDAFIWRSSDIEQVGILVYRSDKEPGGIVLIDCEFLSHHLDVQDIIDEHCSDTRLTNQDRFFWRFTFLETEPNIATIVGRHLAAAVARLTDGVVFCHDDYWSCTLLPAKADSFLEAYLLRERLP
jgi:hypothetical protein